MTLELYGSPISPFTARVLIQMAAKHLDIPLVDPPEGLSSEAYAKINPMKKIPALRTEEGVIIESEVICDYLEKRFPDPTLISGDLDIAAHIRLIARVADIYVMNAMLPLFGQLSPKARDQQIVSRAVDSAKVGLTHLNHFIEAGPYATQDRLTLADCSAAPVLLYCETFLPVFGATDPLKSTSNVAGYWQAINQDAIVSPILKQVAEAIAKAQG